jgi:DNA-binding CsgD family transcriptional regulator
MPLSMVGRAGELGELVGAWSGLAGRTDGTTATTPAPRTAVITGAGGVGKSLLVTSALAALDPRPPVALSGAARVHTPAPYDWLAAVLSERDTDRLPVPPDALAWLAQHPDAPRERYTPDALLRLAVRAVRALIGDGPAVIVVEDLHGLDPASLNLIGALALAPRLPALLLVTSRPPDAADSPRFVARALARLTGTPGAIRQHLTALDPDGVAEILTQVYRRRPATGVIHAVWRRTEGNPYCLTELLATAGRHGPDALAREPLPGHLHAGPPPGRANGHRPGPPAPAAAQELTAREIEVLSCLANGMSNKQVARSLGISIRTVTVHVSSLLRKTRSASRTEAALWAVRHRLADPERR